MGFLLRSGNVVNTPRAITSRSILANHSSTWLSHYTVMCEMSPPSSAASLRVDQCVEQVEAEWQKPIGKGSDACGVGWLVVFWRWPHSRIAPIGGDDAPQWKVAPPPTWAVCAPPEAPPEASRMQSKHIQQYHTQHT